MTPQITKIISICAILAICPLLGGCNTVALQSKWAQPVTPDDKKTTMEQSANYFDEDSKVRVSILNNDDTLYIQLITREQKTKMLFLRAGFTVWIDRSGEARKDFGLLFPLPKTHITPRSPEDHRSREGMNEKIEDSRYNLAILNGLTESRQTMVTEKAAELGIYVRLRVQYDYLIYELQLPLERSQNSDSISIGFESGRIKMAGGRGGSNDSGGGGKGGGKGGGRGKSGMQSGQGGGSRRGSPNPIDIWAQVRLATNPN